MKELQANFGQKASKPRKWHWLSLPPIGALDNKIEFQKFTRRAQPKFVAAELNDKALIKLK